VDQDGGELSIGRPGPPPAAPPLSDRERDIVALVADGLTNPEIGVRRYITPGTVKTHLTSIQRKLRVRNRVGIAAWSWQSRAGR
jgi:DNA-binding CsgD family transcriptional regulator